MVHVRPSEVEQLSSARRIRLLSGVTLVWLAVDGAVGMTAGIAADSVALIGWGLDCAIQAVAAVIIIWRFSGDRLHSPIAERRAQQIVALSFMMLVPYIVVTATDQLLSGTAAGASWIGVALAATDAVLMPFLGSAKQRMGHAVGSGATMSAGKQNILCAYLSVAVLVGLVANAVLGWWWADPVVALLVAAGCLQAGAQTWRGNCGK